MRCRGWSYGHATGRRHLACNCTIATAEPPEVARESGPWRKSLEKHAILPTTSPERAKGFIGARLDSSAPPVLRGVRIRIQVPRLFPMLAIERIVVYKRGMFVD